MKTPQKPHKHADLIKAWADGAEIEAQLDENEWVPATPTWDKNVTYRLKPEPKPDIVEMYVARGCSEYGCVRIAEHWERENLKLTFDGETRKLKSAEVTA